ncbi:glycosyl transferase family 28 [Marinilongibacter aquaticus]|uniref:glycosyltransferase n=1 Tax=Marinilongibacter aquaticus TaxID=2975157 RepID=UPI0021BDCF61|nr:glycosyltransferase [Marinilongibacter aquaticus]UBM58081.1 glycosyl transferase family 28 [Marinilongibacter aquaticus]
MIFVTTGTQLPFDRLIEAIDKLAEAFSDESFIVQISNYDTVQVKSQNIKLVGFLEPEEFNQYFDSADLIIGHAGMGTILKALEDGKALVVFPRKASLVEHRNDHQMATVGWLKRLKLVNVAESYEDLVKLLHAFKEGLEDQFISEKIESVASESLISELKSVLNESI